MKIDYSIEGNFGGNGQTDLVFMDGGTRANLILMDINGQQVALKLTPSQSALLAQQLTQYVQAEV